MNAASLSPQSHSVDGVLQPNSDKTVLGLLGGGQLGRMFVHEAQAMGFKVMVLEPEKMSPAAQSADEHIVAAYDDEEGLAVLSQHAQAITTEFENVPAQSLASLATHAFVSPSADCVRIAQNRILEKQFFTRCAPRSGIFPAPHAIIEQESDIERLADDLFPAILKTATLGYDGKGQVRVKNREELRAAFSQLKGVVCVLEKMLALAYEVSVLVVRAHNGQSVVYPIAENVHRNGILHTTTVPSPNVSETAAKQAQEAALIMIAEMNYVGVLCIEFFVLQDGSVAVNEMAPRPHNSGHYTIDACTTSQFAQQVRAMAKLPLGEVRQHSPCVMLNILGDVWFAGGEHRQPAWDQILALPSARLHLYGKANARHGRKMGHITFVAPSLTQAYADMEKACHILGIPS